MSVKLKDYGTTSKFKSCFGDLPPLHKKTYVSTNPRPKPITYFDTIKRSSHQQPSQKSPSGEPSDEETQVPGIGEPEAQLDDAQPIN